MIIEELVLHDFGVYRGRNVLDLTPTSHEKPIILIGARNGRGKTTILDAINLVLFGSRGRLSNRGSISWEEYLRRTVHRRTGKGAAVSLRFSLADDFEVKIYEVTRSWQVQGKTVKESFDVIVNGRPDKVLAEDWNEHIEALLPIEVASLNFFDGEKIDELADPVQSRNVLRAAINGLLGLGVLERLEADLKVYLRRKVDEELGEDLSEEILQIEAEMTELRERRTQLTVEKAQAKTAIDRSTELQRRIEEQAKKLGADKWEHRLELEETVNKLKEQKRTVEDQLQEYAGGIAPLLLVKELLSRTAGQVGVDDENRLQRDISAVLEARDAEVLRRLDNDLARQLKPILESERAERSGRATEKVVHQSHPGLSTELAALSDETNEVRLISASLGSVDDLDNEITHLERLLMSVPAEDQLLPVLSQLTEIRTQAEEAQISFNDLSSELEGISKAIERLDQKSLKVREAEALKRKGFLEEQRAREYANKALSTIESVGRLTVARNISLMEDAILQRFRELIGKKDLITSVHIDRDSLEISVRTNDGGALSIDQLSAGERQLLATAVLWGLSTVAGRSMPLVIDTPLGRLDGEHREKLAEKYFPAAAKQVVILSTDSEFTGELRSIISDSTSREYLIEFDEDEDCSRVKLGYFPEAARVD